MSELKKVNGAILKDRLREKYHMDPKKLDDWDYFFEQVAIQMNHCVTCRGEQECLNNPQNYQVKLTYTSRPQISYETCRYKKPVGPVTYYSMAHKAYEGALIVSASRAHYFQYEDKILDDPENAKGIFLYGPFGTGKSYLLHHLCKELAGMGYSCDCVYYPDLVNEVNRCIKENILESRIDEFKKVDVLLLDDIGSGLNTAYVRDNVLNSIFQERMNNKKLTLMTSNCDKNALLSFLEDTKDATDNLKAARLVSWMESMMDFIELKDKDYRANK